MTDSETAPLQNAGVIVRLAAMIYDGLLLFAILCLATLLAAAVTGHIDTSIPEASSQVMYQADPMFSGIGFQIYLLAVIAAFYCIFWHKSGQTLGMQAWRLKVVTAEGATPGWGRCLLRSLTSAVSILPAGLGYWWIWVDRNNMSWHDHLSGTRVIRLPKKK